MSRRPIQLLVTAAVTLAAAACGSGSDGSSDSETETTVNVDQAPPGSNQPETSAPATPADLEDDPLDWELGLPADVAAGEVTLPAAGGVSFDMENGRYIFQDRSFFSIEEDDAAMIGAEIHERLPPGGDPVLTADDALEILTTQADVTPLNESIVVSGVTLDGYTVEAGMIAADVVTGTQFSSAEPGGPPTIFWFPGRSAVVYLADAPNGGALLFGYEAPNDDILTTAKAIFDEIAPTLALT